MKASKTIISWFLAATALVGLGGRNAVAEDLSFARPIPPQSHSLFSPVPFAPEKYRQPFTASAKPERWVVWKNKVTNSVGYCLEGGGESYLKDAVFDSDRYIALMQTPEGGRVIFSALGIFAIGRDHQFFLRSVYITDAVLRDRLKILERNHETAERTIRFLTSFRYDFGGSVDEAARICPAAFNQNITIRDIAPQELPQKIQAIRHDMQSVRDEAKQGRIPGF
jgi:hypothetical protein